MAAVIGVIVVLGIVAIVLVAIGGDDDGDGGNTAQCTGATVAASDTVEVSGAALTDYSSGADPCIGRPAPRLVGEDFEGRPVEITADGRAKAIAFVAHWCPHCQVEVPVISDYLDGPGLPENVDLYFVATSTQSNAPNYPPSEWLEREGVGDVPTIADDEQGTAHRAYGSGGFPYLVLVDAEGAVAARFSGELGADAYPAIFDALAAGEPIPGVSGGAASETPAS
jgi:thiol-disulfide isomerase/thioredoxin